MNSAEKNHPIRVLLQDAAMGQAPTKAELDAIASLAGDTMPERVLRRGTKDAADRVLALRRDGERMLARREAEAAASELINPLPERRDERDFPDDPRALASMILDGATPDVVAIRESIKNVPRF